MFENGDIQLSNIIWSNKEITTKYHSKNRKLFGILNSSSKNILIKAGTDGSSEEHPNKLHSFWCVSSKIPVLKVLITF